MRTFPDSPFLRGNYAPWPLEGEITDLVVRGELPRDGAMRRRLGLNGSGAAA